MKSSAAEEEPSEPAPARGGLIVRKDYLISARQKATDLRATKCSATAFERCKMQEKNSPLSQPESLIGSISLSDRCMAPGYRFWHRLRCKRYQPLMISTSLRDQEVLSPTTPVHFGDLRVAGKTAVSSFLPPEAICPILARLNDHLFDLDASQLIQFRLSLNESNASTAALALVDEAIVARQACGTHAW